MGHGAWMGITWGNMEDGRMGPKHSSWNVTCFGGISVGGSNCPTSKCPSGCSSKLDMFRWVVGFEVLVLSFMFHGMRFLTSQNECRAIIETWHVFVSICFGARVAYAWKPKLGRLKASDAFMTCCWNNIKRIPSPAPLVSTQRSKVHPLSKISFSSIDKMDESLNQVPREQLL
jgi:hypothetical protein